MPRLDRPLSKAEPQEKVQKKRHSCPTLNTRWLRVNPVGNASVYLPWMWLAGCPLEVRSMCRLNSTSCNSTPYKPIVWPPSETKGLAVPEKSTSGWLARNASRTHVF